jgi:hypothetical protein
LNLSRFRSRRLVPGLLLGAALSLGAAVPALAADTVTQTLTPGNRTASVANLGLPDIAYSHALQTSAGTMTLTADDSTGSGAGWNVTVLSSAFVYSGVNSGTDIPAANFSLTSAATPTLVAGQAVDGTGGPKVPTVSPVASLDSARKVVQANAAFGQGNYSEDLGVSLAIPADTRAGTYTGTLTTTISSAP